MASSLATLSLTEVRVASCKVPAFIAAKTKPGIREADRYTAAQVSDTSKADSSTRLIK